MIRVYIGSTYKATFPYPDGLNDTYTYQVIGASGTSVLMENVFTVDGSSGNIKVTADTTSWKAGEYQLQVRATKDAEVVIRSLGYVCAVPSVFSAGAKAIDPNSTAQKPKTQRERILAAAWTALENASDNSAISVSTDGFSTSFESRGELLRFINDMEKYVAAEKGRYGRPLLIPVSL